jgi:hypothetical protein
VGTADFAVQMEVVKRHKNQLKFLQLFLQLRLRNHIGVFVEGSNKVVDGFAHLAAYFGTRCAVHKTHVIHVTPFLRVVDMDVAETAKTA